MGLAQVEALLCNTSSADDIVEAACSHYSV